MWKALDPIVATCFQPYVLLVNRPAGTPRAIIAAINRVVSDGMHAPQMAQRLASDGSQPAERMTPAELKTSIAREYAEIEQQVKQLNIKFE